MIRLTRVRLEQVGPFAEKELTFDAGLNVVVGPNEAGKSTVARAILAVLVGDPEAERLHRRAHTGAFGAAVRLEDDAGAWIVDRDFDSNEVLIKKVENGKAVEVFRGVVSPRGRSAHVQEMRKWLLTFFGLPDPQLLPLLLSGELTRAWPTEAADRVRQLLTGQMLHDHQKVHKSLQDKYFAITRVNPGGRTRPKPGRLEKVEERIRDCKTALADALASADELAQAEDAFAAAEARQTALEKELKAANEQFERFGRLAEIGEKQDELRQKKETLAQDIARVQELSAKQAECQARLREHIAVDSLTDAQLQVLRQKRGLLATADEREQKRLALAADKTQLPSRRWRWALPAFAGAVSLVILTHWLPAPWSTTVLLLGAILGIGALAWMARGWLAASTARRIRQTRLDDHAADRDRARRDAQELTIGSGFDRLTRPELDDVLQRIESVQEIRRQADKLRAQLAVLPPPADLQQASSLVDTQLTQVEAEAAAVRRSMPVEVGAADDGLSRLAARLESLENALERAQKDRDDALALLAQRRDRLANPLSRQEELEDLKNERDHLLRESQALWLAVTTLEAALERFVGEDLTRLATTMQQHFDRLVTGNKRHVAVDGALTPLLADDAATYPLDLLSRATSEQLLLCGRLALLDQLTGDKRAPLWLDDAAVGYDRTRRDNLLSLLRQIAAERQVIVFTAEETLVELAGPDARVIRLP
jgi:uncharacterized protein YhaN